MPDGLTERRPPQPDAMQRHALAAATVLGISTFVALLALGWQQPAAEASDLPTFVQVASGSSHTCGLTDEGAVRCWGYNNRGQLGDFTQTARTRPVPVKGLQADVRSISAGSDHTCAVMESGAVKCWGFNQYGQVGNGTSGNSWLGAVDVTGLSSGVASVDAGTDHTCALLEAGGVKCWGRNQFGQLGNGANGDSATTPIDVNTLGSGVAQIAAGDTHTCARTNLGVLKCWGNNFHGELGIGSAPDTPLAASEDCPLAIEDSAPCISVPTTVPGFDPGAGGVAVGYVGTGGAGITCVAATVAAGAGAKCWGFNGYGQVGNGTTVVNPNPLDPVFGYAEPTPQDVTGLSGVVAIDPSDGVCALLNSGGVKCWGLNNRGHLGDGTLIDRHTPVDVTGLQSGVASISTGGSHSCVVMNAGGIKCWGANDSYQLGANATDVCFLGIICSPVPLDVLFGFVVNRTGDEVDADTADFICDVDTATFGEQCSLRAAIQQANASEGKDWIFFQIATGVQTIAPLSPLPTIGEQVVIDATTQPGFSGTPLIELTGGNAGAGANGLTIASGKSTVRGLAIDGFNGWGVLIALSGSNRIAGNYIGADVTGSNAKPNVAGGISIEGTASNIIGGTAAADRNVISGNTGDGVRILAAGGSSTGNTVLGNLIGLTAAGNLPLSNRTGVLIVTTLGGAAGGNIIGGSAPGERNVISGSVLSGVLLQGDGASGNTILGNYIGTDVTGLINNPDNIANSGDELSNGEGGVSAIEGAADNIIGGSAGVNPAGPCQGACNLISGNRLGEVILEGAGAGNKIEGNFLGTTLVGGGTIGGFSGVAIRNTAATTVGGVTPGQRNLIGGGVAIFGPSASGNTVQGNFLGVVAKGDAEIGSAKGALLSGGAHDNLIGGTAGTSSGGSCTGACNVVAGVHGDGIVISGSAAINNTVQGNFLGLTIAGFALGNEGAGISVTGCGNLIGGTSEAARNYVGANATGIEVTNLALEACPVGSGNHVEGNYIGVAPNGSSPRGNVGWGVSSGPGQFVGGPGNTTPGGACTGACNLISANTAGGVSVGGETTGALTDPATTMIQGNYIGTDFEGKRGAVDLGNGGPGISTGGARILIGGAFPEARNIIADNEGPGVDLAGSAIANRVQGNYIGLDTSGAVDLGNAGQGVNVGSGPNLVGGEDAGTGNVISGNEGNGVNITGSSNLVLGNIIGLDASGASRLGNSGSGVRIEFITGPPIQDNHIGGTTAGARNVISANGEDGVTITGAIDHSNAVEGNFIGTDVTGTVTDPNPSVSGDELGNANDGVYLNAGFVGGASNATNGDCDGGCNVISGNGEDGVHMYTGRVVGNFIGLNVNGAARGNKRHGVYMEGPGAMVGRVITEIGCDEACASDSHYGNVISANQGAGIFIQQANEFYINNNLIGTDPSGANGLGTQAGGIMTGQGTGVQLLEIIENTVSGNAAAGITLQNVYYDFLPLPVGCILDPSQCTCDVSPTLCARDVKIFGNKIGTDRDGHNAVPNNGPGVALTNVYDAQIGGVGQERGQHDRREYWVGRGHLRAGVPQHRRAQQPDRRQHRRRAARQRVGYPAEPGCA